MQIVNKLCTGGAVPFLALRQWLLAPVDARVYRAVTISFAVAASALWVDVWPLRHSLCADTGMFGPSSPKSLELNVFAWAGSEAWVTAWFATAAVAILGLLTGIVPRLAAALVYLWIVSYSHAAPFALGGFDTVFRITAFVLLVSPSTRVLSWPSRRVGRPIPVSRYGLRLLQWQLMLIYVCTVWLKAPDRYWRNGEVTSYFGMSLFGRFPDAAFARLGALDGLLTYATLLVEALVPVLLWVRRSRWVGMALGLSMHLGIAVVGKLGLFSLAMLPLYLAFLEDDDLTRCRRAFLRRWPQSRR